jgi:prepilin-type N-terminal cleavage/methylation domain-containing protein
LSLRPLGRQAVTHSRIDAVPDRRTTRPRPRGFTLIELLIALTVLAILVSLAAPSLAGTKGKAFDTVAQNDLQSAITAQEAYFADHQTYASSVSELALTVSDGVELGGGGTATGYLMTARHTGSGRVFSVAMDGPQSSGSGGEDGSGGTPDGSPTGDNNGPRGDLRRAS